MSLRTTSWVSGGDDGLYTLALNRFHESRSSNAIINPGRLFYVVGDFLRPVHPGVIEHPKTLSRVGVDIDDANLLTGSSAFPGFVHLRNDADFAG